MPSKSDTKSDLSILMGCLMPPMIFLGLIVFLISMLFNKTEPVQNRGAPQIADAESPVSHAAEPRSSEPRTVRTPIVKTQPARENRNATESLAKGMGVDTVNSILGSQGESESLFIGNGQKKESYTWKLPDGNTLHGNFENDLLVLWFVQSSPSNVAFRDTKTASDDYELEAYLQEWELQFDSYIQNARNLNIVMSMREHNGIIDVTVGQGFFQLSYADKTNLTKIISLYYLQSGRSDIGLVRLYDHYDNKLLGKFYGGMEGKLKLN